MSFMKWVQALSMRVVGFQTAKIGTVSAVMNGENMDSDQI